MADLLPLTTSPPTLRTALIPGTVCSSNQTQLMNSLNTFSGSALLSQCQRLRSYRWEHSSSWLPLKDHVVSRVLIGWVLNLFSRKKNLRPFPSFFLIFSCNVKINNQTFAKSSVHKLFFCLYPRCDLPVWMVSSSTNVCAHTYFIYSSTMLQLWEKKYIAGSPSI